MKIDQLFKKQNAAQHQLVGSVSDKITKPRDLNSDVQRQSLSNGEVDGELRLPGVPNPKPDLAKTFTSIL